MDAAAVLDRCKKLERDGQERERILRRNEDAIGGDYQDRKRRGRWRRLLGGGDFSSLYYDDDKQQKIRIVVNILNPMVEAKRGLIGKMVDTRVPVSGIDPETQRLADANELRIRAIWRESKMKRLLGDMGWYLPIHGDCVGFVDLDLDKKKATIGVRSGRGFYAVPKDFRCIEIAEACFVATYSGLHAAALFDRPELEDVTNVTVYEYWNEEQHSYITEAWKGFLINNENKFAPHVPLSVIPNKSIPGSLRGDDDVSAGIELVKEYNRRYAIETEAIVRTLFAPWIVKNPLQVPKEISLDPYSVIPVGEGGDVKPAQPAQIPWQWMKGKEELRGLINTVTGTPSALTGEMDSQTVTAKAFNASLGPLNASMEVRNVYQHDAIEHLTMLALKAQCEIFGDDVHKTFAMSRDGVPFALEYRGKEIEGYYENEVFIPGSSFVDEQTEFMQVQAALNQGRMSKRSAMRYDPRIQNIEDELAQIDAEKLHEAQIMAQAQAIMAAASQQPPMQPTGGAPGGAPPPDAAAAESEMYAAERGGAPAAPPTAPPGGLAQPAAPGGGAPIESPASPLGGPPAEPEILESDPSVLSPVTRAVIDEFRDVYGIPSSNTVYLAGPVLQGNLSGPGSCEVYLSDMNDKATIVNHMKKDGPEIYGTMEFYSGEPPEGIAYVNVGPGSNGYETEGATEDELPPDMGGPPPPGMMPEGMPPGGNAPAGAAPGMGNLPPEMMAQVQAMMGGSA